MTFVDDDEVEVAGGVFGVFIDQGLQSDDRDALLVLETPAGSRHPVTREMGEVFGERVFGLDGKGIAIHDEERAGGPIRLEQALQQSSGRPCLAGAGGHFDQHFATAIHDFLAELIDAGDLVEPPAGTGDARVDRDVERIAANGSCRLKAGDVVLTKDRLDPAEMRVPLLVAEPDFFAVREENIPGL